jgi:hypothetical protein
MNINTRGRTPEESGLPAGDITRCVRVAGNGRKRTAYRVQYDTMYFDYSSLDKAKEKRDKGIAAGKITLPL